MSNKLRINALLESFSATDRKEWEKAAISEINNDFPDQKLAWKGPDNIPFLPYYDQTNITSAQTLTTFQLNPFSKSDGKGPRTWFNQPFIIAEDENTCNQKITNHLKQGADGFFLHFATDKQPDIAQLLSNIDLSCCHASFHTQTATSLIYALADYMHHHRNATELFNPITVYSNSTPEQPEIVLGKLSGLKNLSAFGFHIPADTNPITEIKCALLEGVSIIDRLTDAGYSAENAIHQISFSLEAGNNFFYTVAKIKVLRLLWFQIAHAFNDKTFHPDDLSIHIRCEVFTNESLQPHGNMLKSTSASVAAILGGCNALSIHSEDVNNEMMSRVARNVSAVLREESHLHRVADPLAGSYFLEELINTFTIKAWENFQKESNVPK